MVDSTGALALSGVPKKMLILGGGIIGLEMRSGSVFGRQQHTADKNAEFEQRACSRPPDAFGLTRCACPVQWPAPPQRACARRPPPRTH